MAAIGGVPFFFNTPVRDSSTGLFVGRRGCITLGPDQALAYARSRHLEYLQDGVWISDGTADLGRISRQQDFIRRALARTVSEGLANPLLLGDVLGVASDAALLDDSMGVDDFIQLGRKFRGINDDTLQTLTLDVSDDTVNGSSILRLQDTEANERKLGIFRGASGAGSQQAPEISVIVLNGTGTDGQAGEIADGLDRLGFDTSPGPGTPRTASSATASSATPPATRPRPASSPPRSRAGPTSKRSTASRAARTWPWSPATTSTA